MWIDSVEAPRGVQTSYLGGVFIWANINAVCPAKQNGCRLLPEADTVVELRLRLPRFRHLFFHFFFDRTTNPAMPPAPLCPIDRMFNPVLNPRVPTFYIFGYLPPVDVGVRGWDGRGTSQRVQ